MTSTVRVLRDGRDLTDSYSLLYNDGQPLAALDAGETGSRGLTSTLGAALLRIARDGRACGSGPALDQAEYVKVANLAEAEEGTYHTGLGWKVVVTKDDPHADVPLVEVVAYRHPDADTTVDVFVGGKRFTGAEVYVIDPGASGTGPSFREGWRATAENASDEAAALIVELAENARFGMDEG